MWEQQLASMVEEHRLDDETRKDLAVAYAAETNDPSFIFDPSAFLALFTPRYLRSHEASLFWLAYEGTCSYSDASVASGCCFRTKQSFSQGNGADSERFMAESISMSREVVKNNWF